MTRQLQFKAWLKVEASQLKRVTENSAIGPFSLNDSVQVVKHYYGEMVKAISCKRSSSFFRMLFFFFFKKKKEEPGMHNSPNFFIKKHSFATDHPLRPTL